MAKVLTNSGLVEDGRLMERDFTIPSRQQQTDNHPPVRIKRESEEQYNNPLPNKITSYLVLILLALLVATALFGVIWFNLTFAKMTGKEFGTNIPITVNDEKTFMNNNTNTNQITNNYEHILQTQLNITSKNEIQIPDEWETTLVDNIVDGVLEGLNQTLNLTNCSIH